MTTYRGSATNHPSVYLRRWLADPRPGLLIAVMLLAWPAVRGLV